MDKIILKKMKNKKKVNKWQTIEKPERKKGKMKS